MSIPGRRSIRFAYLQAHSRYNDYTMSTEIVHYEYSMSEFEKYDILVSLNFCMNSIEICRLYSKSIRVDYKKFNSFEFSPYYLLFNFIEKRNLSQSAVQTLQTKFLGFIIN